MPSPRSRRKLGPGSNNSGSRPVSPGCRRSLSASEVSLPIAKPSQPTNATAAARLPHCAEVSRMRRPCRGANGTILPPAESVSGDIALARAMIRSRPTDVRSASASLGRPHVCRGLRICGEQGGDCAPAPRYRGAHRHRRRGREIAPPRPRRHPSCGIAATDGDPPPGLARVLVLRFASWQRLPTVFTRRAAGASPQPRRSFDFGPEVGAQLDHRLVVGTADGLRVDPKGEGNLGNFHVTIVQHR